MNNQLDHTVNFFYKKCAKLNISPECCPEQNYLQKILRQRLSLFESFNNKADAKNDIENIRKNILIQLKLSGNELSKSSKTVPKEYNNYVKYKILMDKVKILEAQNQNYKQHELQKLQIIKNNELRLEIAKESLRINQSKLDLLQAKSIHLNENIAKEQGLDEMINKVTPNFFLSSDDIDDHRKRVSESIEILKKFSVSYTETIINCIQVTKKRFLNEISEKVSSVPNVILFQLLLQQISSKIDSISMPSSSSKEQNRVTSTQSISNKLLPLLYEHKIVKGIELLSLRRKLFNSKSDCAASIQILENEMDLILNASLDFSFELEDGDIISDFVAALIAKLNCEGKIQFCSNIIISLKQEINNNSNIKEYKRILNETKEIYSLIGEKIVNVQEYVAQVHQINEKINFSKISIMRMIQSLKMEKSQQHNRTLMNQTLSNTTLIASNNLKEVSLPMHENEFQAFLDIALYKLEKKTIKDRLFLLRNGEKVILNTSVYNGHFLFPQEYLIYMKNSLKLRDLLKPLALDLESSVSYLPDIDFDSLKKQHDENCEEISSILDTATRFNIQTKNHLRDMDALYEYGIKNPLRKFIPATRKYLDKTYNEYEKEYMLYYNMIKN